MSLIIRRVENISKKKRKSRSTTRLYKKDLFEDDASKFTVIEDFYSENFPPLRPVYRKDIFGTPIVFRLTNGIDYYGDAEYNVLMHCITFIKEYKNKSFEELRWEDYSCDRKEILHYEENSYLRSLSAKTVNKKISYEFFDPMPKNIPVALTKQKSLSTVFRNENSSGVAQSASKKIPNISKTGSFPHSLVKTSKSFEELFDLENNSNHIFVLTRDYANSILSRNVDEKVNHTKELRPRSILTYVDKLSQTTNKNRPFAKSSSDICLNAHRNANSSKRENVEMTRNNLVRYFEKAEPCAKMHYDLITQNPKFFLPCADISFVYQNARPLKTEDPAVTLAHVLKNFHKPNPRFGKACFLQQCLGDNWTGTCKKHGEVSERKYTSSSKFRKEYFWNEFSPYSRCRSRDRVSRTKYILAGEVIVG